MVVAHSEKSLLRRANYGEAVLDTAYDGRACMETGIADEVPGRYQDNAGASLCVRAGPVREIHIHADRHAPLRTEEAEQTWHRTCPIVALLAWEEASLVVFGQHLAVRREDEGGIPGAGDPDLVQARNDCDSAGSRRFTQHAGDIADVGGSDPDEFLREHDHPGSPNSQLSDAAGVGVSNLKRLLRLLRVEVPNCGIGYSQPHTHGGSRDGPGEAGPTVSESQQADGEREGQSNQRASLLSAKVPSDGEAGGDQGENKGDSPKAGKRSHLQEGEEVRL